MNGLEIAFQGFVQVRLATDPDPSDEPRGIGGWTHAVAGEPDLDRALVMHEDDPRRVPRSHGPTVGVHVHRITDGTGPVPDHPLLGARVELLDTPVFEGRNWIVAGDGAEPIDPLHLRIRSPEIALEKRDVLTDADGAEALLYQLSPERLAHRLPVFEYAAAARAEVLAALDVTSDPLTWRAGRRAGLKHDLDSLPAADDEQVVALRRRIADLNDPDPDVPAVGTVGVRMRYTLDLNGPGTITDPQHRLAAIQPDRAWPLTFWVGGWDADALCMFMRGALTLPF